MASHLLGELGKPDCAFDPDAPDPALLARLGGAILGALNTLRFPHMWRQISKNIVVNAASQVLGMFLGVLLSPYLIRGLGKSDYGLMAFFASFSVNGVFSLFTFGINGAVVKMVAQYRAQQQPVRYSETIKAGLLVFFTLGIVAALVLAALAAFGFEHVFKLEPAQVAVARLIAYITAAQLLIEFPNLIVGAVFEGLQRFDLSSAIGIGYTLAYWAAVVILIHTGAGVLGVTVGTFVLALVLFLARWFWMRRLLPELDLRVRIGWETTREIVSMTKYLFVIRLQAVVYNTMDKVIIGRFLGMQQITDYDVASKLHRFALMSQSMAATTIMPAASALHAQDERQRLQQLFLRATKITVLMSVPLTCVFWVGAPWILRCWLGVDFVADTMLTRLFLSYLFFWALTHVGYNMLVGMGQIGRLAKVQLGTTALNLLASVLLAARLGTVGVILGTIIGNAAAFPFYWAEFERRIGVPKREFAREVLLRIYPAAAACGLLLYCALRWMNPVSVPPLLVCLGSALALFYLSYLGWGMTREERDFLQRILPWFPWRVARTTN
jgi:O-antigen/teichoic acid export membrane protein